VSEKSPAKLATPREKSDRTYETATEVIYEHYRYTAFGEPEIYDSSGNKLATSAIKNEILWNSRRYDSATNLYYYKYRHYKADYGRWTSTDPIEERGGVNLYNFVHDRPFNYWDGYGLKMMNPSGREITVDWEKCTLTLEQEWQILWNGAWSKEEQTQWKKDVNKVLNDTWGSAYIKVTPYKWGSSWGCANCDKLDIVIDITFDEGWSAFEDVEVTVNYDEGQSFVRSDGKSASFDRLDVNKTYKGKGQFQYPISHEFGHILGLDHPGANDPDIEDSNSDAAYDKDVKALMGRGSELRQDYFDLFLEGLTCSCKYEVFIR
jgi:RHS repeat-associated protein